MKNIYTFRLKILARGGPDPLDSSYVFPDSLRENVIATTIADSEKEARNDLPGWVVDEFGTKYELKEAVLENVMPMRNPGRPRQGLGKLHVDLTLSREVIQALEQVTSNKSQFIDEWLRQHPEIIALLSRGEENGS